MHAVAYLNLSASVGNKIYVFGIFDDCSIHPNRAIVTIQPEKTIGIPDHYDGCHHH